MYDYGKHLGLAFQVVDDILDFTQTSEQLGKPQGQDLASGNLTAPVIFALRNSPELVRPKSRVGARDPLYVLRFLLRDDPYVDRDTARGPNCSPIPPPLTDAIT